MDEQLLRKSADLILKAGLNSVDPYHLINVQIKRRDDILYFLNELQVDLNDYKTIRIVGIGKGVAPMAKAMEDLLGENLAGGDVIVKYDHGQHLAKIDLHEAGHPIPDDNTLKATKRALKNLKDLTDQDLVFVLITGGGSALLEKLPKSISLEDLQNLNGILLNCGATIHEINCIRKHISLIKGGQLARHIYPAKIITLALSDVVGDDLSVIASGPTAPDDSTFNDALEILKKYRVTNKIPENILQILKSGSAGKINETPKEDDEIFQSVTNIVIGSNRLSLIAAEAEAKNQAFNTVILSSMIEGEAKEIARMVAAIIKEIQSSGMPVKRPACILMGGEPIVNIKGKGKGGRNQEIALAVAHCGIKEPFLFLSCGTDGTDGPTDAAGAIVTNLTGTKSEMLGLSIKEYLSNNDAYNFFKPLKDLIITGPTRTNVMDIMIAIVP